LIRKVYLRHWLRLSQFFAAIPPTIIFATTTNSQHNFEQPVESTLSAAKFVKMPRKKWMYVFLGT
jgi:hypothetical protein